MNRNLSLVLVVAAAACGLALAQVPQKSDAAQIAALEKRVDALEAKLADLSKVNPGAGAEFEAAIVKDRQTLEGVVKYLHTQSSAAEKLQAALDDSQQKGFTFGINPDSRVVLLDGIHVFADSFKAELPPAAAEPAPTKPAVTPVKPPPLKTPVKK